MSYFAWISEKKALFVLIILFAHWLFCSSFKLVYFSHYIKALNLFGVSAGRNHSDLKIYDFFKRNGEYNAINIKYIQS